MDGPRVAASYREVVELHILWARGIAVKPEGLVVVRTEAAAGQRLLVMCRDWVWGHC